MNDIPSAGEVFRGDDGTISTILPSNYGQDYEASEGELEEYAEYIGIDSAKEPELMWIAKEGLRAALPDGWRACQTEDNEVYYFNFRTGESLWDHPMDEHYKRQVINARAKRDLGGSVGATSGSVRGTARTAAATGSTKAIADSFFLKPPAAAARPTSRALGSLADIGSGVTAATIGSAQAKDIRTPGSSTNDGIRAPRAPPEVSDILALSSATSRPPSMSAGRSTASAGLSRMKEWEAALRKQLEERNGAQLRALRIELDKKEDAERQRLAEARAKLQKDLDTAWEREKSGAAGGPAAGSSFASAATQRRLQVARDVKQIEESWKTRLHDVGTRVRELQQQVEAKQQALTNTLHESPEELRKKLEARNAAEVAQLQAAKKKEMDAVLADLQSKQAPELAEARLRANNAVAAAQKATEAEFEDKLQRYQAQGKAMLAAMHAAVDSKEAAVKAKEKDVAASPPTAPTTNTAVTVAKAGAPSDTGEALLAAAQAAADGEVAKAREASAAAVVRLREEYAEKRREKEAALRAAQQLQQPLSRSSLASSGTSSPTVDLSSPGGVFSAADQERLDEEDQKLRDEVERAARIFAEETYIMVENKKAGRPLTAAPSVDVAASVSAEAMAALGRTVSQEQRARDAENTRHFMAMKQLEAQHDRAVRAMKAQLDKNLASSMPASAPRAFNPRQQPSFVTQLTARKRAWMRDHPAPSVEMPTLPPVPTLPNAILQADVAASSTLGEEEQARLIEARLAEVREEAQRRYDQEAQALRKACEEDLDKWRETHRSARLEEVEKALAALKESAVAESEKTVELRALTDAAAAAEATAGEGRRLERLQSELQALDASIVAADREHERQVRALEESIAGLEASLTKLRTHKRREEEAKSQQQQQQRHLQPNGGSSRPCSAPAVADYASPSRATSSALSALYIPDEEAANEEAALRARWTALLKALRATVQREMEVYERALDGSSAQQHSSSTAAAAGTHPAGSSAAIVATRGGAPVPTISTPRDRGLVTCTTSSLPPPAPSAMTSSGVPSGPPAALQEPLPPRSASSLLPTGATATSLSGYSTPLQRPPHDQGDGGAGTTMLGGAVERMPAVSPAPQLYLMDARSGGTGAHGFLPMQRPSSSSSSQPQPRQVPDISALPSSDLQPVARSGFLDSQQGASASSAAAPWADVRARAARSEPLAGVSAAPGQRVIAAPADRAIYSGWPAGGGPGDDVDGARARHHAARLAALQQMVRARRQALKAQRREMESLRDEWRTDMRDCKRHGDRAQARRLREVKTELELLARELNEEVLRLKEVHESLHEEVHQFRRWMNLCQQPEDLVACGGVASVTSSPALSCPAFIGNDSAYFGKGEGYRAPSLPWEKTVDVARLLQRMVDRTGRLEELLLSRLTAYSPSPHCSDTQQSDR
ncbi:hypothetical protein LSCM1_05595 [Leishmania martiniquensis]|uniref:WW domain-containing protein n=1 Tax=Leishmania martiniquensis TaxID=1580590 RepID=A0A836HP42_9TRYP|nr:hypothetical protein LSCM1_05595 [Leishmania martiniquensis]